MSPNPKNNPVPDRTAASSNPAQAQQLFTQAFALHQQGQLAEAQALYEQVLQIQPAHFDALHLTGIIAVQTKNPATAVELISQAIAVNPQNASAHYNQGVALQALGRLDAAQDSYSRAVALKPDYLSAHYNRGVILQDLKQYQAALESYNQVIALKPDHADAYNNRGVVLQNLGQHQAALESYNQAIALKPGADVYYNRGITLKTLKQPEAALESYNRAIALQPGYADAYNNRGLVLQGLRQLDAALESYNQAIALQPGCADAHYNRGNVLREIRQFQAALESYDRAIALQPDHADACYNRGVVLHDLGQHRAARASHDQAIDLYSKAIAGKPDHAEAYYNRGNVLKDTLQFQAALENYDQAIALRPDYADAHWVSGLCRLLTGDFEAGWEKYEWRWRREEKKDFVRKFSQPRWSGTESLQGKTILLYSEQGFGDTLQFCRYAKRVADLGATVILEARRPLITLLGGLAGVSTLVAEGEPLPAFDFQCPLMSLPLAFRTTLASIPAPGRYLAGNAKKMAGWQARLGAKTRLRVGLAWSGSATHKNDLNRSIPLSDLIKGLPRGPQYVSLQKELRAGDDETLRLCTGGSQPEILHFGALLNDFADTAALCELVDIVISVDTSIAHLAGAMDKPLWLLLPFHPEWRWLLDRSDSPWYPSARLYRQAQIGDWEGVMQKVHVDLSQRLAEFEPASNTVAMNSQDARTHYNRGNALQTQGDLDAAIGHYRQALLLKPDYAEAHNNLGIAFLARGETDAAIESYRQALLLRPDYAKAHNNLGNALQAQGRFEAAARQHLDALALEPNYAEAHNNLGNALLAQDKFDAAVACYQKALTLKPDYAEAYFNLGSAFQLLDRPDRAIASYRQALTLQPCYVSAYNNLGSVLLGQGKLDDAIASYRKVIALQPDYAEAYGNLGSALLEQGELHAAVENYQKALSLRPDSADAHSNLLLTLSYQHEPDQYLAEARRYGDKVTARAQPYTSWPSCRTVGQMQPLRIGLVSGDLRMHPVGFFLENVIAHLNPARVELAAYSTVTQEDALTARIKPNFAAWNTIAYLSDKAAAQKIHEDGIHILVDLAGHTAHNRLPVFAWKPAPVQLSWLGYFASTGMPGMDYLLADPVSVPESQRAQFTETIKYLPETRLCFTPPADVPRLAPQPPPVARNGYITFASFQKLFKINDKVLALWGRVFDALPNARLRLQNMQVNCPVTSGRLLERLSNAGISRERVIMVGQVAREDYLAAHAEVDIILDTFPYTGGTTTCEALWMGVPTLTLAGNTMLSRQGVSLLACAGLQDWVAKDADDYVARALDHASSVSRLTRLREGLRQQVLTSPLFDAPRFAAHLEAALYDIWNQGKS